jgi:hypothetical protein
MFPLFRFIGRALRPSLLNSATRITRRGLETTTTVEPLSTELRQGEVVIGPCAFNLDKGLTGYPVIPLSRFNELYPNLESVLPAIYSVNENKLPSFILWKVQQAKTRTLTGGVYLIPYDDLKKIGWVAPQHVKQCASGQIPEFKP